MAIDLFLNAADCARVARTFLSLAHHEISGWALTGGVAIELHILRLGGKPIIRRLNDLDFVAACFDSIPESIGSELLLRHVHPHDPPGKIMLPGVDPETGVRVDVFRGYGMEMERTSPIESTALPRTLSLLDLVARHARLNWDLVEGRPVAPKYARDFLRLMELVRTDESMPRGSTPGRSVMAPARWSIVSKLIWLAGTREMVVILVGTNGEPGRILSVDGGNWDTGHNVAYMVPVAFSLEIQASANRIRAMST
jgi:hypothetical protein